MELLGNLNLTEDQVFELNRELNKYRYNLKKFIQTDKGTYLINKHR